MRKHGWSRRNWILHLFGKKSDSNTENVYYMIVSDEKEFMKDYLEKYQLEAEDKPVKWRESFNLKGQRRSEAESCQRAESTGRK